MNVKGTMDGSFGTIKPHCSSSLRLQGCFRAVYPLGWIGPSGPHYFSSLRLWGCISSG